MNRPCAIGLFQSRVQYLRPNKSSRLLTRSLGLLLLVLLGSISAYAATSASSTNSIAELNSPALPDFGTSILRLLGALVFVLGLFMLGVTGVKRWQRNQGVQTGGPKLVILNVQTLGAKQAVYVIGYERQRFLVGTSPAGIHLISHLPDSDQEATDVPTPVHFAAALQQVLGRKAS